jgi:hypothetical protein
VTAVPGSQQATVAWRAPWASGGTPVTSYTVTASPGGVTLTVAGTVTSASVTGLTNNTASRIPDIPDMPGHTACQQFPPLYPARYLFHDHEYFAAISAG